MSLNNSTTNLKRADQLGHRHEEMEGMEGPYQYENPPAYTEGVTGKGGLTNWDYRLNTSNTSAADFYGDVHTGAHGGHGGMETMEGDVEEEQEDVQKAPPTVEGFGIIACWKIFKRGLRGVWSTRDMEDIDETTARYLLVCLRELFTYLLFLIVLLFVVYGMVSENQYWLNNQVSVLLTTQPFPDDTTKNFGNMALLADFWDWSYNILVPGIYNWTTWYNSAATSQGVDYVLYENKLLGVPRLRQLRVQNNSCSIPTQFTDQIKTCYAAYSKGIEDTSFSTYNNGSEWVYQSSYSVGAMDYEGQFATYGGGGYVALLGKTVNSSLQELTNLYMNLWLDRGTRALFLDFTLYNANLNLFAVCKYVIEMPASGGVYTTTVIRPVKLIRYATPFDYFIMACECLFCVFIVYYIVEEIIEIKHNRFYYFLNFWNCLDIILILISLLCIAFDIYRSQVVASKLSSLIANDSQYLDFDTLSYWQVVFDTVIAWALFIAYIKIFKYVSFSQTMSQLQVTLGASAKDLLGFAVMFGIIFLAFAQFGFLAFGTQVEGFRTLGDSMLTLFRIILGDFDFQDFNRANRYVGPIFFILYVFFVFFVLLNMFIAIICDTYADVRSNEHKFKRHYEVAKLVKKQYREFLKRLAVRRKKAQDINTAIAEIDNDPDMPQESEIIRASLKLRGFTEAEIGVALEKYKREPGETAESVLERIEQEKMKGENEEEVKRAESVDEAEKSVPKRRVKPEEYGSLKGRIDRMENAVSRVMAGLEVILEKIELVESVRAESSKDRDGSSKYAAATAGGTSHVSRAFSSTTSLSGNKQSTGARKEPEGAVKASGASSGEEPKESKSAIFAAFDKMKA